VNGTALELSVGALAAAAEREGLGTLHPALQPEPMWYPREERDSQRSVLDGELAEAGLVNRRGRLDPDFLDLLPVLTNASLEYFGWLHHDEVTWSALAASRGMLGVLAVRRGDRVTLTTVDHNELPSAFVGVLPEIGPGGGTRWVVRMTDMREGLERTHRDRSIARVIAEITKVMERPVLGGGELYLADRDPSGTYRVLRSPLRVVDTDWGRYLNYRVRVGDEEEFCVQPAAPATVMAALESLRGNLVVMPRQ